MFSRAERFSCWAVIVAFLLIAGIAQSAAAADVELWRLDCGEFKDFDISGMSDTFAYPAKKKTLSDGCYLIRHEKQLMLWDTGLSPSVASGDKSTGLGLRRTLVAQLREIKIEPQQISVIGVSHGHFDHTGQAASFPKARLLMGKADFDAMTSKYPGFGFSPQDLAPWLSSSANVERVVGDKDVFGDGSVIMLATPGHTTGHHSLLVRLPKFGPVVLSGDLWHFAEQVSHNGVPSENVDRADTLASMDRIQRVVSNLKATLVIQHEASDIGKLPLFPASAQ